MAYLVILTIGLPLALTASSISTAAMGLGIMLPGAGFLAWAGAESATSIVILAAGTFGTFGIALVLWFATGNVLAPPMAWAGAALFSAVAAPPGAPHPEVTLAVGGAAAMLLAAMTQSTVRRTTSVPPPGQPTANYTHTAVPAAPLPPRKAELSQDTLRLMRMLLDRALQPVAEFNGFDRRDQFQTAAMRYQINFISYALSIAQAVHMPHFDGYLAKAQANLALKQQDYRMWAYWRFENLWGNLRINPDPIPDENIMFSGFLAAQLSLADNAGRHAGTGTPPVLRFAHSSGRTFFYSLTDLMNLLENGFHTAPMGLIACEPNWVYPLCNAITATALRAADVAQGTDRWQRIAPGFRKALETGFTRADGRLVPFLSVHTGMAAPAIGGAVMQALPSLFLNPLLPDLAARHWERTRSELAEKGLRRALWPVDVGNYGFSRASSYAATAAAAIEMGDTKTASDLLSALDEDCPARENGPASYRPRASVWAHALEAMARCGTEGALRQLVLDNPQRGDGPRLAVAPYADVCVASARHYGNTLTVVLYPTTPSCETGLVFSGIRPGQTFRLKGSTGATLRADVSGTISAKVRVSGRTELVLYPVSG